MTEEKKRKFADKGKAILGQTRPTSIQDILEDKEDSHIVRKPVNTEIRKISQPQQIKNQAGKSAREEFRFTEELAERLRQYAFDKRKKKTDVVTKALEEFFDREGY